MTQPDKLGVTQEARDAAAAHWFRTVEATDANFAVGHHLRIGAADHNELVQAFQRAMKQAADERQEMMPDYIDLFRLIRGAGRSNAAKAKAVDAAIRSIGKGGM